jgi:hypothetical protein
VSWLTLGGVLLIAFGAIWLLKSHKGLGALRPQQRASVLASGIGWILFGVGALLVGHSNGKGGTAAIGLTFVGAAIVLRVAVGLASWAMK